jgi:hypothetical protein
MGNESANFMNSPFGRSHRDPPKQGQRHATGSFPLDRKRGGDFIMLDETKFEYFVASRVRNTDRIIGQR